MRPFWAAERLTEDERRKAQKGPANHKIEDKEFSAVAVGASGGGSMWLTFTVVVPIMTNAADVKKGEGLLLQTASTKETKRKEGSWKDGVAKAAKAPMVTTKANPAPSLEVPTEI